MTKQNELNVYQLMANRNKPLYLLDDTSKLLQKDLEIRLHTYELDDKKDYRAELIKNAGDYLTNFGITQGLLSREYCCVHDSKPDTLSHLERELKFQQDTIYDSKFFNTYSLKACKTPLWSLTRAAPIMSPFFGGAMYLYTCFEKSPNIAFSIGVAFASCGISEMFRILFRKRAKRRQPLLTEAIKKYKASIKNIKQSDLKMIPNRNATDFVDRIRTSSIDDFADINYEKINSKLKNMYTNSS